MLSDGNINGAKKEKHEQIFIKSETRLCQRKMETQTLEIYTNTQQNEQEIFNAKIKEEEK